MSQITIDVPQPFADLPEPERNALIQSGIHAAVQARIDEIKAEIAEAESNIRTFEERYGQTFEQFEQSGLNRIDTFQAHESYQDWLYWIAVRTEKVSLLAKMQV